MEIQVVLKEYLLLHASIQLAIYDLSKGREVICRVAGRELS